MFFLYFFVEDLAKAIKAHPTLRDAFDFSEIYNGHILNFGLGNADLHAGKVGYFTKATKGNLIIEFVGLRLKMYLFTVCDESEPILKVNYLMNITHIAVAKGVARSQIKRF